ncbi:MAG: helix-turn-helix domain-containing protein [Gemmatimonadetes bacterium]|nr:helix-turn-helix domain-containing protein [Gemmatimonadota bacterium]
MARRKTSNAVEILSRRYARTKKEKVALEEARAGAEIARKLHELRTKAGITQAELARLVGTSRTVITRLEDDDYDGHSLSMLRRVAAALNKRVELRFVSVPSSKKVA